MTHIAPAADDWALIPIAREVLAKNKPKALLILHANGRHSNYADRYPPEFEKHPVDRAACPVARFKVFRVSEATVLRSRTIAPFSSDHLFHAMSDLIGVRSSVIEPNKSLCSTHYNPGASLVVSRDRRTSVNYDNSRGRPSFPEETVQ